MIRLAVRAISPGSADAPAVVSNMPINFPAAFLKALNILPFKRGEVRDPNHDLFRTNVAGKALVFPTCIGSTYTGLVLLELIKNGHAPAIIVVSLADPLLVSGAVLARIWYNLDLPILEVVDRRDLGRIAIGDRLSYFEGDGWIRLSAATAEKT